MRFSAPPRVKTSCYGSSNAHDRNSDDLLVARGAVEVDRLAHQEGRTRSELLREAFRQYAERRQQWDQTSLRMERNARRPAA